MKEFGTWIGREENQSDRVEEALVRRWLATMDRAAPEDGTIPQGFHWCLCTPETPMSGLGDDGHAKRDGSPKSFLPPVPLPRRMWASGKLDFLAPLRPGQTIARTSRIASITEKQGGSGRLVFVDVVHDILADGAPSIREVHSIVYRGPVPAGSPLAPPPPGEERFDPSTWDAHRELKPSEPLLFRYSALTFNGHRIHYDAPYCQGQEGYRGIIVHGPLIATLLLDLLRRRFGDNAVKHFAFRGLSPAIAGEPLHLVLRGDEETIELGAFAADGRPVTSASAVV